MNTPIPGWQMGEELPEKFASGEWTEVLVMYEQKSVEGGVTRLEMWPEGLVLWHHGEIVWREWAARG